MELVVVEARQHRHAGDDHGRPAARLEHGPPAGRMGRRNERAEGCGFADRVLRRARNVVNLQVEEDALPARDELAHKGGPVGDECLEPDLQNAGDAMERVGEAEDLIARGAVEGHNQTVSRLHDGIIASGE